MKKKIIVTVALLMLSGQAFSRDGATSVLWSVGFPTSDFYDYIKEVGFGGVSVDSRTWVSRTMAIGFSLGWNTFNAKDVDPIKLDIGTVTGTQLRYLNSFPIMLTGHYYTDSGNRTKLYIGGQVGIAAIIQRVDIGVIQLQTSNWHPAIAPEIGADAPLGATSLVFGVRYFYAFDSGTSVGGRADNTYSYAIVYIGLAFQH